MSRHLSRYLFNGLAALSLVLCVVVCVLWVRSYRVDDVAPVRFAGEPWQLVSVRGWLILDNWPVVDAGMEAGKKNSELWIAESDAVRHWEYRRAAARADGRQFDEPRPERSDQLMPYMPDYLSQRLMPHAAPATASALIPAAWLV